MKSLLIRAEDKNIWERRATIVPDDLKSVLAETGAKAFIEKSEKRFFKEQEYINAGAEICQSMEPGEVIFGVKEIPEEKILNNKTYFFFSHTIKGQKYNMSMLKRIMDSGSTLIDYEKITDEKGRRLVFFGRYAGDAGAVNILWLLGEYWQNKGLRTPLAELQQVRHYHSVKEAREKITKIGDKVRSSGFPEELSPVVVGILGYGNVSQGAQQIFECLPVQRLEPDELKNFMAEGKFDRHKIYLTVFKEEHLARPAGDFPFELQDYYNHPEKYKPKFRQYLPYISILLNATYWEKRYPRFVTWDDLKELNSKKQLRLQGIADITCDINGSIECNIKCTDSGMPAYRVLPETKSTEDGHKGDGIVFLAVDNLPAELPKDASEFFSKQLRPWIPSVLKADFSKHLNESALAPELQRAVIVYKGELTPTFRYLEKYL